MNILIVLVVCVVVFCLGYFLNPYITKIVKRILNKTEEEKTNIEEKVFVVKDKLEKQINIAKEKGVDISVEFEEIYEDLEDIIDIIKR